MLAFFLLESNEIMKETEEEWFCFIQEANFHIIDKQLTNLRAFLCKNQTKLEMKNFDPPPRPTQIYMEVGPHEVCSKMPIIELIT